MAKLAIDGGPRAVPSNFVPTNWPSIDEDDISSVVSVLRTQQIWGTDAPSIVELEKEWGKYCGVDLCHGTNGGTAALHQALAASGVGAGDEVIVPAYSFHSSASCILHHNAIPVFCDIDFDTYTIDWTQIESLITEKTKAILAVDLFGLPASWEKIIEIARKHNIIAIEDGCQAHGASIDGKMTGALGDICAFSLNGSKNLAGAEGGLLTTNNADLFGKTGQLDMSVRTIDGKRVYPEYSFGWNYRMNVISATLTLSQLKKLDMHNGKRIENCEYLSSELSKLDGLIPPKVPTGYKHVYHMYKVALDPALSEKYGMPLKEIRDSLLFALNREGINTSLWVSDALPNLDIYQKMEGYGNGCPWTCPFGNYGSGKRYKYDAKEFPNAQRLIDSTFNLDHTYPPNGKKLMDYIILGFQKVWEHIDELLE
jgi:dTDP-4-amino-4,6-dideoxygalactose transaminase